MTNVTNQPIKTNSSKFTFTSIDCKSATEEELIYAWNNHIPITGITTFGTHPDSHIDEQGGIYLIQNTPEGRLLFPGIEKAGLGFLTETYLRENKFMKFHGFIKALSKGCLLVGIGKGPLDEHSDRVTKISCTELVVKHINLYASKYNRRVYGPLISFINHEDNNGDNLIENLNKANASHKLNSDECTYLRTLNLGMIARNMKNGYEAAKNDSEKEQVFRMCAQFIKNEVEFQKLFVEAEDAFNNETMGNFELPNGKYGIVIESDIKQIGRIARKRITSDKSKEIVVMVICRSNGQFVILPQNGMKDNMIALEGKLVAKVKNSKRNSNDPVYEIYLDENTKIIMNGSKTDPDVPGLIGKHLSIKSIVDSIKAVCTK